MRCTLSLSLSRLARASPSLAAEEFTFQTETKRLLDIVTNALYTDKHIFIRELISNASDACEKARHRTVTGESLAEPEKELGIWLTTDEEAGTFTIADSGIGLSRQELIDNLGTIALSGSRAFAAQLAAQAEASKSDAKSDANIIGQFGVGFYSAFMVADEVRVTSRSALPDQHEMNMWKSAGHGNFTVEPVQDAGRGTSITLHLKDSAREFANAATVEDIIKRYSNYVSFPIYLNNERVNTVGALWSKSKDDISEEEYTEFFKFKAKTFDEPLFKLHFSADAPISLQALFFVGKLNEESVGMGRMRPGVDLYSRRVLIEAESEVMPAWLRFLHGVVDSEDIPLNISRESMQDTALMRRIRTVLTRRVLRFFESEMKKDRETYEKFWQEHGSFLREGACTDHAYQADIAKLLLFESSALPPGQLTTLDEYISRARPGQNRVYYLVAPHRGLAEKSPYMEAFRPENGAETEVLFLYNPLDDFVMTNLHAYNGRTLTTAESSDLQLDAASTDASQSTGKDEAPADAESTEQANADAVYGVPGALSSEQVKQLGNWLMKDALPRKLKAVRASTRLSSTPAVVVDHESSAMRRMMRMLDAQQRDSEAPRMEDDVLPRQTLEINPKHVLVRRIWALHSVRPDVATLLAEQLFDNTLVAAGLLDDARSMVPRLNAMMQQLAGSVLAAPEDTEASPLDPSGLSMRHVTGREMGKEVLREVMEEEVEAASKRAAISRQQAETAKAERE